jgi:hypothetical protein
VRKEKERQCKKKGKKRYENNRKGVKKVRKENFINGSISYMVRVGAI